MKIIEGNVVYEEDSGRVDIVCDTGLLRVLVKTNVNSNVVSIITKGSKGLESVKSFLERNKDKIYNLKPSGDYIYTYSFTFSIAAGNNIFEFEGEII